MNTLRKLLRLGSVGLISLALPFAARAQSKKSVWRMGHLSPFGERYRAPRRAEFCVDKIIKCGRPGDVLGQKPTKFDLWVNVKTIKAFVIKVPQLILVQTTRAIE